LLLIAALHLAPAHAVLGGDSASIEADRSYLKVTLAARRELAANGSYTMHEMVLPSGVLIRQYVSASDKVFAITWVGPFMPDLRRLLGPYFDIMNARTASQPRVGHSVVTQHEPDLVIESGGHPRSFAGRAYLPQAIPAGVDMQEIH
jgi:hypothetical protein